MTDGQRAPRHCPVPLYRDDDALFSLCCEPVMDGALAPISTVELLVCVTCRNAASAPGPAVETDGAPRAGALLLAALAEAALPERVRVVPVECLSNCTRGCTVALRGSGRWTYVYGNLAADQAGLLVDGVARYAAAPDGLVPWRERPEHFRKNCIARIPPLEIS